MILLLISLIAGFLTVLAPCVLPLLPVIVGGTVSGGFSKKKAFVVTISLGISVIVFTLLLKASTLFISVPPEVWMWISGGIIILFGIITIFPKLWDRLKITAKINRQSNKIIGVGYQKQSLWGDIIIGAALGPVFSSCSPTYFLLLATVLPQGLAKGILYLGVYTLGLCVGLLIIAFLGQTIISKLGVASDPESWLRRAFGVLFLIVGVAIFTGADKKIEARILSSGVFDITRVEQSLLQKNNSNPHGIALTPLTDNDVASTTASTTEPLPPMLIAPDARERVVEKSQSYPVAPEFVNPSGFINTNDKPIHLSDYKGKKVVLLDVWTYSCINCQRTLPYIKAWYDKYKDQGLEVIGLHTPEFAFEKVKANVEKAAQEFGLTYPIVQDNNYSTWNAYGNQYWPRKYLIDIDGYIVYDHIGEGNYEETEKAIQKALAERNAVLHDETSIPTTITKIENIPTQDSRVQSPETYFGSNRNEYFGNGTRGVPGTQTLKAPTSYDLNTFYFDGAWNFSGEFAESLDAQTKIIYKYNAKNVYFVGSSELGSTLKIFVDGSYVKTVEVKDHKLYNLVGGLDYGVHTLEIQVQGAGLEAYTFTFG